MPESCKCLDDPELREALKTMAWDAGAEIAEQVDTSHLCQPGAELWTVGMALSFLCAVTGMEPSEAIGALCARAEEVQARMKKGAH